MHNAEMGEESIVETSYYGVATDWISAYAVRRYILAGKYLDGIIILPHVLFLPILKILSCNHTTRRFFIDIFFLFEIPV